MRLGVKMVGEIHQLADGFFLIEGQHPTSLWEAADIPSIVVYRRGSQLYLLDSGVGPQQRRAIVDLAASRDGVERVLLLNSHAHVDHLGNNDVLADLSAREREHWISQRGHLGWDYFRQQYGEGASYFSYTTGLDLSGEVVASLLHQLDPSLDVDAGELELLGSRIRDLGLLPLLSDYMPGLLVDTLARVYPPTSPSYDTMQVFERRPETALQVGETAWRGWSFGRDDDPDVLVFLCQGHSAGGVVFYIPEQRFLMFADETTSIPIWSDTNPDNTAATLRKARAMADAGHLESICAGHFPMLPVTGAEQVRVTLDGMLSGKDEFERTVDAAIARHPEGISIDELFEELAAQTSQDSMIRFLINNQFPRFATFVKLTLLHHCQRRGFTKRPTEGRFPRFSAG
jgi:glyoxylase-like metal-dependent hydrolase (beta-lactamase superfamily II)